LTGRIVEGLDTLAELVEGLDKIVGLVELVETAAEPETLADT